MLKSFLFISIHMEIYQNTMTSMRIFLFEPIIPRVTLRTYAKKLDAQILKGPQSMQIRARACGFCCVLPKISVECIGVMSIKRTIIYKGSRSWKELRKHLNNCILWQILTALPSTVWEI